MLSAKIRDAKLNALISMRLWAVCAAAVGLSKTAPFKELSIV
jgi:hypothetical protein